PVELRGPSDEVVDLWLECRALTVVPGVLRHVPVVDEHGCRVPVLDLPWQPVAPLEDQHPPARRCEPVGERSSTRTGSHDDHVVLVRHVSYLLVEMCGTSSSVPPHAMRWGVSEASM